MKLHFEAVESVSHEGTVTLSDDEAAEYRALSTDEERQAWIVKAVRELVWEGDHDSDREVEDPFGYVEDDDG